MVNATKTVPLAHFAGKILKTKLIYFNLDLILHLSEVVALQRMCVCVYMHVCVCVFVYTCMCVCVGVCVCVLAHDVIVQFTDIEHRESSRTVGGVDS